MEEDPSLFTSSSILVFHIFMCMNVCLHLLLSLEAREGIGSTTARVMGGCKMSCWHWELSKSSRCSSHWAITPAPFIIAVVYGHPYGYAVLSHCGFDWCFLLTVMLILFVCSFAVCVWFLEQYLLKFFAWFLIISFMLLIKVLNVSQICIHIRRMIYKNARNFRVNWMLCFFLSRSATILKWASLKFIMRRFMTFWFVKVKMGRENNQ